MIYLDYASHTPVDAAVLEEFCRIEKQYIGNPSSRHNAGQKAQSEMEQNTLKISQLLNVKPNEIIYTSGASEANNLAIKGIARSNRHNGKHILSTCLEHPSVSGSLTALQEQGYEIELINILPDGTVDLQSLKELLRRDTILVTVCCVDSELGAIQPIQEIAEIIRKYPNCRLHVDAAQAVGKIPVNFEGIDCVSFSPHKFHGLCGCGILYKSKDVVLEPLIHGGLSTTIYRSGTPALALAASSRKALELALTNQNESLLKTKKLQGFLISSLKKYTKVRINSPENGSPYILNISVDGVKGDIFHDALNKRGVYVSVKSACSVSGTPSRPVYAISGNKKIAMCSWRISLSRHTCMDELDSFLEIFDTCYKELTSQ